MANPEQNKKYREMHKDELIAYELARRGIKSIYRKTNRQKINAAENFRIASIYEKIDLLKHQPCSDCGFCFEPEVMDFDHKPEFIKFKNITRMARKNSIEKIMAEINKCDLVCKNCHRIRTRSRAINKCHVSPARALQIRKTKMVDELKKAPCMDCDLHFPPECMDFDHIQSKAMDISRAIRSKGFNFLQEELKKTELVCAVCHQRRTFKRLQTRNEAA